MQDLSKARRRIAWIALKTQLIDSVELTDRPGVAYVARQLGLVAIVAVRLVCLATGEPTSIDSGPRWCSSVGAAMMPASER